MRMVKSVSAMMMDEESRRSDANATSGSRWRTETKNAMLRVRLEVVVREEEKAVVVEVQNQVDQGEVHWSRIPS